MNREVKARQRIGRLAPLAEIEAAVARLARPVAARSAPVAQAHGRVLAQDVVAAASMPPHAAAARDGWAVSAESVADASAYAPALLARPPTWVDAGDALPDGSDAVLPPDVVVASGSVAQALAAAAPGEGVLTRGFDAAAGAALAAAGRRLSVTMASALATAGITHVSIRPPRLSLLCAGARIDPASPALALAAATVRAEGAEVSFPSAASEADLPARLLAAARASDAVIAVGGAGEGRGDQAVDALAAAGEVVAHGFGIRPGEGAALGRVADRVVLMLPERWDGALAVSLLVGTRMLRALSGRTDAPAGMRAVLARKIISTIGLAEVVLVEVTDGTARPLASGPFSAVAAAAASGWVLVPPELEGFPGGAAVTVHALP
ncbi:MAG: molybdopterin-binding protein [Variibacter sp.]|nr:molybdopterin-binding protein [Variibacter sp.]